MTEFRTAFSSERDEYLALADMVFSLNGSPISFERSIPKVYGTQVEKSCIHHVAVDSGKGIRAIVAALPGKMLFEEGVLKTGYIGTVCVHPDDRGRGYMKRLMNDALDDLRGQGCDIALLGGARQRYEYFGFTPGGEWYFVSVDMDNVRHALGKYNIDGITFEEILPGGKLETCALELYKKQCCYFDRTDPGFAVICRSYGNTPWAMLRNGGFAGFFVSNECGDTLHEAYTVDCEPIETMIAAWIKKNENEKITLSMPAWRQTELRRMALFSRKIRYESNVSARIMNYASVIGAFLTLKSTYSKLSDGVLPLSCEGERFTVTVRDNRVFIVPGADKPLVLDCLSAGRLLLYPFPYDGRPEVPDGWFPLPLYVTAPDKF